MLVTAPDELREQLAGLPTGRLVRAAAALEPGRLATPAAAVRLALRGLAGRYQHLDAEVTLLTEQLDRLTSKHARRCAACPASVPTAPPRCWSPPVTTPAAAL